MNGLTEKGTSSDAQADVCGGSLIKPGDQMSTEPRAPRQSIRAIAVALLLALAALISGFVAPSAMAAPVGDRLVAGAQLSQGDSLESPNVSYRLDMQTDGNLVLYGPAGPLWASHTNVGGSNLVNQADGNLVIVRPDGGVEWDSRTNGLGAADLVLQDDGNLVAYAGDVATWTSYTAGGVSKMAASGAVAYARDQLGKPYVWGAEGPDAFDCSGLTQQAYASVGVAINRTSQDQYLQGSSVSADELQPGDLVFYNGGAPTHVGIYVGNGEIINALNSASGIRYDDIAYPGSITGYRRMA